MQNRNNDNTREEKERRYASIKTEYSGTYERYVYSIGCFESVEYMDETE